MLGYIGGFIRPLAVGWTLDVGGGMSQATWAMAFVGIALLSTIALAIFWLMRPHEVLGDRIKPVP